MIKEPEKEASWITDPKIEDKKEVNYLGIRTMASMQEMGEGLIPRLHSEIYGLLRRQGIQAHGAPFIRYYTTDMDNKLDIELAVPVADALEGDGRIRQGVLPAGRYATLVYTGIARGYEANKVLIEWAEAQHLVWDTKSTPNGEEFGSRYEAFLTEPDDEPDMDKWQTEVGIRLADA